MLTAKLVLGALRSLRVTHVVGIPDNASAALHSELNLQAAIQNLTVTREGEAFAIAAGLWIGGKTPSVLIQNTGLLESGDSLRGTLVRMRIPVLSLVTCRGYANLPASRRVSLSDPPRRDDLSDPGIDSVALLTEPTLRGWGIPFWSLRQDHDIGCIEKASQWAQLHQHPAAVLVEAGIAATSL